MSGAVSKREPGQLFGALLLQHECHQGDEQRPCPEDVCEQERDARDVLGAREEIEQGIVEQQKPEQEQRHEARPLDARTDHSSSCWTKRGGRRERRGGFRRSPAEGAGPRRLVPLTPPTFGLTRSAKRLAEL